MVLLRALCLVAACAGAAAQPTLCLDESQCDPGYYCEVQTRRCRECLSCAALRREPLPAPSSASCVRSIAACGPCLNGLVEDPSGNVEAPCVVAGAAEAARGPSPYVWLSLAAAALLVLLIVALVLYVLRNTHLKIFASTRASLQSPCSGAGDGAESPPAAPGPPPPYRASAPHYEPVRPTSPPAPQDHTPEHSHEAAHPFIKRSTSVRGAARERDSSQQARVFNNPHYVRGPELPPSYDSALSDNESQPDLHDEDTMESMWSPSEDTPNNNTNPNTVGASGGAVEAEGGAGSLAARLREARADDGATPNKQLCVRQDNNNNRRARLEAGEGTSSAPAAAPAPAAGPAPAPAQLTALNFNITVQQHNDVKLIST